MIDTKLLQFTAGGSSDNPCSDIHAGVSEFSEPETKAMSHFYNTIADRAVFFLTIHSYTQLILLPYGYSADRYPDYEEYVSIICLNILNLLLLYTSIQSYITLRRHTGVE